jgi:hypothetical protein
MPASQARFLGGSPEKRQGHKECGSNFSTYYSATFGKLLVAQWRDIVGSVVRLMLLLKSMVRMMLLLLEKQHGV